MSNYIQSPPKQQRLGCFGKGCLLIAAFLVLLVIAFVIGFYTGTKPKELPKIETSEQQQNEVRTRWDEFEAVARNEQIATPAPPAATPEIASNTTPAPAPPSNNPNRIE